MEHETLKASKNSLYLRQESLAVCLFCSAATKSVRKRRMFEKLLAGETNARIYHRGANNRHFQRCQMSKQSNRITKTRLRYVRMHRM